MQAQAEALARQVSALERRVQSLEKENRQLRAYVNYLLRIIATAAHLANGLQSRVGQALRESGPVAAQKAGVSPYDKGLARGVCAIAEPMYVGLAQIISALRGAL